MSLGEVNVQNVGPVGELTISFPSEGGVTLVKGKNGAGKTHALDSVQSLVSGKGKLPVRDHQPKAEVEGFGAVLKIGKTARRTGEVDVVSLEGRFDLSLLWDPGIANPEAADARRIKALVQLSGTRADHTLFHKLAAGQEEFDRIVKPESIATDDLVTMAARVKRDFDAAARQAEDEAANLNAQVKAARESAEGVDLEAECESVALSLNHQEAIVTKARLEAERDRRNDIITKAAQSQRKLDEAAKADRAPIEVYRSRLNEAACAVKEKQAALKEANDRLSVLQQQLQRARDAVEYAETCLGNAEREHAAAGETLTAAESRESLVRAWQEEVDAAKQVQPVAEDEIVAASAAVDNAWQAVESGVKIREAKKNLQRAANTEVQAKEAAKRAARLREAAKSTDDVLSEAVKSDRLRVSAGRLVLDTERGKDIPLADLSDGERWKVALDEAVKHIGEGGLIVLPQHAWDAQDPDNQVLIHEEAKRRRVHVLTAKRDRGDLRVEQFDPQTAA